MKGTGNLSKLTLSPKLSTISSQSRRSVYFGVFPALISSSASFLASNAVIKLNLLSNFALGHFSSLTWFHQHLLYHRREDHCNFRVLGEGRPYLQDSRR